MLVKELRALLEEADDDAQVYVEDDYKHYKGFINGVYHQAGHQSYIGSLVDEKLGKVVDRVVCSTTYGSWVTLNISEKQYVKLEGVLK